jgi:hypothetical protein
VDFWAQHKDFILKILAGVGVFLVALIARSITYGDELEKEQSRNTRLASEIRSSKIAPRPRIRELEEDAKRLDENARAIAAQIGWNLGDEEALKRTLLERILRSTRRYSREGEESVKRAAEDFRAALREELNGGFGQLRLVVQQELISEASEKNIRIAEGVGYGNVTEIAQDELLQYLLQLELVSRVVRYAIDARVDSIEEVRITQGGARREAAIPGANPEFLQEYDVTVIFTGSQAAVWKILDRLEQEPPRVTVGGLRASRAKKPEHHLSVELTLRAMASNPEVPFAAKEKS